MAWHRPGKSTTCGGQPALRVALAQRAQRAVNQNRGEDGGRAAVVGQAARAQHVLQQQERAVRGAAAREQRQLHARTGNHTSAVRRVMPLLSPQCPAAGQRPCRQARLLCQTKMISACRPLLRMAPHPRMNYHCGLSQVLAARDRERQALKAV